MRGGDSGIEPIALIQILAEATLTLRWKQQAKYDRVVLMELRNFAFLVQLKRWLFLPWKQSRMPSALCQRNSAVGLAAANKKT